MRKAFEDCEQIVIKHGRHKGKTYVLENNIIDMGGEPMLLDLADHNRAAFNALVEDDYDELFDAPFYYGHIKEDNSWLGYIVSHYDVYGAHKIEERLKPIMLELQARKDMGESLDVSDKMKLYDLRKYYGIENKEPS